MGGLSFLECGELLYGRRYCLGLKGAVCSDYVEPAVLCRGGALCLKESKMGILQRTDIRSERDMWSPLKDRRRAKDLMLMFSFNNTMD